MADRPGEQKADKSAEALREARASDALRTAAQDLKAFARGEVDQDDPAEEQPAAEPDQGRDTPAEETPRARAADDDGETPGDDYDPEDHVAAEEDGEGPEPSPPPASERAPEPAQLSLEDRKIWDQFQQFRRGQEAKPAQVEVPDLKTTISRLIDSDPEVAARVGKLDSARRDIAELESQAGALQESVSKREDEVRQLRILATHYEEQAKEDPDDLDLVQRARDFKMKHTESLSLLHGERMEARDLNSNYADRTRHFNALRDEIRQAGEQEIERIRNTQTQQADYDAEYAAADAEWNDALPRVLQKAGLHPSMQSEVEQLLAYRAQGETEAPGNLEEWMSLQMPVISSLVKKSRDQQVQTHADLRRRDAEQPAPSGSKAVASQRERSEGGRLTSREALRQSERALRRELGG